MLIVRNIKKLQSEGYDDWTNLTEEQTAEGQVLAIREQALGPEHPDYGYKPATAITQHHQIFRFPKCSSGLN